MGCGKYVIGGDFSFPEDKSIATPVPMANVTGILRAQGILSLMVKPGLNNCCPSEDNRRL